MKRTLTLILAVLMVLSLLAGCNNNTTTSPTPTGTKTPTATPTGGSTEPSDDGNPSTWVVDTTTKLTVWQAFTNTYISSMNDSKFIDAFEAATNVRLEFTHPSDTEFAVAFNLMIASNDYRDIIRPQTEAAYVGGGEKAVEDGVYLQLNDLIPEYAPVYNSYRQRGGDFEKMTITDNGIIWALWTLNDPAEYPWTGLALRKDILDKHNVALPVTLNDWETCLQTFKDDGIKYPLLIARNGIFWNSEFMSAWGIGKNFYNVNGEVRYGYIQPEFKEYLAMMADWYKKGLIDPDFVGRNITLAALSDADAVINREEAAASSSLWGYTANAKVNNKAVTNPDFWMQAVSAPKMNAGDKIHFRYVSYVTKSPSVISTQCKNPEIALAAMDYLYTEEGSTLLNYGIEGETYEMVDGKPHYTDLILKDPDGVNFRTKSSGWMWDDGIGLGQFTRLWQAYEETSPDALQAYYIWNEDDIDYLMPPVTMTDAEGKQYSGIIGDINTFVDESVAGFIMGVKPISEFDAFVAQIKALNIQTAIDIQQAALARYNNR